MVYSLQSITAQRVRKMLPFDAVISRKTSVWPFDIKVELILSKVVLGRSANTIWSKEMEIIRSVSSMEATIIQFIPTRGGLDTLVGRVLLIYCGQRWRRWIGAASRVNTGDADWNCQCWEVGGQAAPDELWVCGKTSQGHKLAVQGTLT